MTDLDTILRDPLSRREFLTRMTTAGLGAAAVTLLAGCGGGGSNGSTVGSAPSPAGNAAFVLPNGQLIPGIGDVQVLNYALALEIAEADLYRQALNLAARVPNPTTAPLNSGGSSTYTTGTTPPPLGGGALSGTAANVGYLYLAQYAYVEAAHRDFLHAAILSAGGTPISPNANGYKFTGNPGNAATGTPTLSTILTTILAVEETGVTAYLGAVPYITSLAYTQVAAAIYSTEARHSSGLRYIFNSDIGPGNLTPTGTVPSGPFVSGSAQPVGGAANEFEYALAPSAVLSAVVSGFFN